MSILCEYLLLRAANKLLFNFFMCYIHLKERNKISTVNATYIILSIYLIENPEIMSVFLCITCNYIDWQVLPVFSNKALD